MASIDFALLEELQSPISTSDLKLHYFFMLGGCTETLVNYSNRKKNPYNSHI